MDKLYLSYHVRKLCWVVLSLKLFCLSSKQEHDDPILKHLQDITVKFSEPGQSMVSSLEKRLIYCLIIVFFPPSIINDEYFKYVFKFATSYSPNA